MTSSVTDPQTTHALNELAGRLKDAGAEVFLPAAESYPDIVAVLEDGRLIAVNIASTANDAITELNRAIAILRQAVPAIARTSVTRQVVALDGSASTDKILNLRDALALKWIGNSTPGQLDVDARSALSAVLAPRLVLDLPQRASLRDAGLGDRRTRRIILDETQSSIAQREISNPLMLTGAPGSGKTLVLAARARWLAEQHPNWRIQVLCFNRILVPYLQGLVSAFPNIHVQTFGKFSHELGYRVALDDETKAARDVERVMSAARSAPAVDALLIDECQDFMASWLALGVALLRPQRGGLVLAGDPHQALYRDSDLVAAVGKLGTEFVELQVPYRSTKPILAVTSALYGADNFCIDDAADGEPVDLVWADNADQQAAAVARDALLLLQSGERVPNEIGILVTRKFQMGKIAGQLRAAGIPVRVVYSNRADELDLNEPTVKVMTVHSAKGLEFDVVFLVGIEHLPDPDGTPDADRQGRTGYVGTTRARDQLVLTYAKDNLYLDRVRSLPDSTLRRWVWPDDYPEAANG